MNIIIAPNAFKGTLSAWKACYAMRAGMKKALPHAKFSLCPLADGGDGFLDVLKVYMGNVHLKTCTVINSEGNKIQASFLYDSISRHAFIESAQACGMKMLTRGKRNILHSTSGGVGELILKAMDTGAGKITVGIGGTAANDAGLGMLRALGFKFYTKHKKEIIFPHEFVKLDLIDARHADSRLSSVEFLSACDVHNVLLGKEGSTYTYGMQKGASKKEQKLLENAIKQFAVKVKKFNRENINAAFCGAGGGLAAGMSGFLNAKCNYGFSFVAKAANLEEKIKHADFVITGEGKVDAQTKFGKAPYFVAKLCKKHSVPCICLAGSVGEGAGVLYKNGMTAIFPSLHQLVSDVQLKKHAANWLEQTAYAVGRIIGAQ